MQVYSGESRYTYFIINQCFTKFYHTPKIAVRLLPVVVVRARGLVPSTTPDMDHQTILPEYLDERIAPRHIAGLLEQKIRRIRRRPILGRSCSTR